MIRHSAGSCGRLALNGPILEILADVAVSQGLLIGGREPEFRVSEAVVGGAYGAGVDGVCAGGLAVVDDAVLEDLVDAVVR